MKKSLKILLLEDNPGDARLINEYVKESSLVNFSLTHIEQLSAGLEYLNQNSPDVILLDLGLPDSQGIDSLRSIVSQEPYIPVIVLTGLNDSEMAIKAMQTGAQDYLIKGEFNSDLLIRVISYSIERKQAEQALQKSQKLLYEAERISHTGAWDWDLRSDQWTVSDEWMRIHGVDTQKMFTQQLMVLAHPEDTSAIRKMLQDAIDGKRIYDIEHRIIRADNGNVRIIKAYGEVIRDQEDRSIRMIGVAQDITERKQTEEAIRQMEKRSRALIQNAPDGIVLLDRNGSFIFASPSAQKIFGYRDDEILGANPAEYTHSDDLTLVLSTLSALTRNPSQNQTLQYRFKHKNGSWLWVESTFTNLLAEPSVEAIVINFRDITERTQMESALRKSAMDLKKAQQVAHVGSWIWQIKTNHLEWSDEMYRIFGLSPNEFSADLNDVMIRSIHPDDLPAVIASNLSVIEERKPVPLEYRIVLPDGTQRVVWAEAGELLLDKSGEPEVLSGIVLDITERKQSEINAKQHANELKKSNDQLVRLYRVSNALIHGTTLDQESLTQLLADTVVEEMGKVCCCLYLLNSVRDQLILCATSGSTSNHSSPAVINLENAQLSAQVVKTRNSVYIPEIRQEPVQIACCEATRSIILAPLIAGHHVIGVINIQSPEPDFFSPQDEQFLQLFSSQGAIVLENANLISETRVQLNRLESLRKIDETINASLDLRVTADVILTQIIQQLDVDAADFLVFDPGSKSLNFVSNLGFNTSALQYSDVRLSQGLAGQAASSGQIIHITDLSRQDDFLNASPLLEEENFIEYYGVPLIAKGHLKGLLEIYNRSTRSYDESWHNFLEALAGQAAIAMESIELFISLQRSVNELILAYDENIEAWSRALDLRDEETEGHTQRVVKITVRLAKALGINGEDLIHIRRGALLHDIGKMGIPDNILLKPGPLSDEEWVIMRKHPVYAFELLSPIVFLKPALDIPYCHHERWDGSGYPRGLKGEQIPLAARIFAIVDVWDALCSDRPYRKAWPENKVIEYIREQAGTHFDPKIVELFFNSYLSENGALAKPTILIVDDEESVTRSLTRSLKNNFTVLTANNSKDALMVVQRSDPAVVLTDQRMPEMTGVELLECIRKIKPNIVGILISGYSDVVALTAAVNLGNVRGFIPKPWDIDALRGKLNEAVNLYRETVRGNQE